MDVFLNGRNHWIALLGGALNYTREQLDAAYEIGTLIACKGKGLVTGATSGIPYAAAIGAKKAGGFVIGISPAVNPQEHISKFQKPLDFMDFIVYTGGGIEGRSHYILRSTGAAIFIGGEMGTLSEFAAAWLRGNSIIGILSGYGGITDQLLQLAKHSNTNYNNLLVTAPTPSALVSQIFRQIHEKEEIPYNKNYVRGSHIEQLICLNEEEENENGNGYAN
jgi:uncharacterized protein (TIGR00725 family)